MIQLILQLLWFVRTSAIHAKYMSIYIWNQICQKGSYTHSFKSHFSQPFDRYNNRLTVHAYTIAKASTVCFYWGLIHGPVWRPRILGWSVNGSNLPSQADSRQGITTGLASETWHCCSYILWRGAENSLNWNHLAIFLNQKVPPLCGSPPPPTLHPYRIACGIDYLVQ